MVRNADALTPQQHFAAFIRALGRGPGLSRALSREEATHAMELILGDEVEPVQLGAFLMLMRYRGESAAEIAGFVSAVRASIPAASLSPQVDLDWPSYADRHKQLPWFVLSALLLAENGVRVLMHGIKGEEGGFVSTRAALDGLGVPVSGTVKEAARRLDAGGFAYLGLESLSRRLDELFRLRPLLGLRSPVHSLARELNPFRAPFQIQGVFHPGYRSLHQDAAVLLGQPHAAVFKGGGGEAQRNPDKPCLVSVVRDGEPAEEEWPALEAGLGFRPREEEQNPARIAALWRGEVEGLPGPLAAITGTAAMALKLLGRARSNADAQAMAERMWRERTALSRPQAAEVA